MERECPANPVKVKLVLVFPSRSTLARIFDCAFDRPGVGFLCQESDVKLNNKPAARLFRTSWNTYDEFVFPKEVLVKERTEWSFIFSSTSYN